MIRSRQHFSDSFMNIPYEPGWGDENVETCHYAERGEENTIHRLWKVFLSPRSGLRDYGCAGEIEHHTPNIIEVLCYIHLLYKRHRNPIKLFRVFSAVSSTIYPTSSLSLRW